MENPTHSFREANLVLQFIQESQFKNQNCDELELAKEKTGHFFFVPFILYKENSFNICVLFQYTEYTYFTYQKTLLHTLICFFLTSLKTFRVSLSKHDFSCVYIFLVGR